MKIGFSLLNNWGIGDVQALVDLAVRAEELGFDSVWVHDHVFNVGHVLDRIGGKPYYEPLTLLSYVAAKTRRVRLGTSVLVLPYHNPIRLAKTAATLDVLSGGRLVLGVGVGSLEEEFALIGAPFDDRGARGDDAIRALTASFGVAEPEYHGTHYDYSGFIVDPTSVQAPVPIWIGGRTMRSLRRAVALADGWSPFGLTLPELAAMLARARDTEAWAARTSPLEVALQPGAFDPIGDPGRTRDRLAEMAAMGATMVEVRVRSDSVEHCVEQLAALRELVD